MLLNCILVFAVALLGGMLQSAIGFGYIIVAMAVWPLFLPVGSCIAVAQLGACVLNIILVLRIRNREAWQKALFPALFAALGSIAGLLFIPAIESAVYLKALGVLLVLLALWMLKFSSMVHIRCTPLNGIITGTVGGLLGAFFGVSAPPIVLYFNSTSENKADYFEPLQITLLIQTLAALGGRAALGMIPRGILPYCALAVAGVLAGIKPGRIIFGKMNEKILRTTVYIMLGVMGLYIFFSN